MWERSKAGGFTLMELMVVTSVFAIIVVLIFQLMISAQRTMNTEVTRDSVEGMATRLLDRIGRDMRESSYAYIFAGDWAATGGAGGVSIDVARNYLSSSPMVGGTTLAPGISTEGWSQCPNAACSWSNHPTGGGFEPTVPHAFLARPARNNPQSGSPTNPPTNFSFNEQDARGRLFGHIAAGQRCPFCGTALSMEAFFSGLLFFSPRGSDNAFSYGGASGHEVRWESMIFYCPYRAPNTGRYEMRRYVFQASSIVAGGPNPPSLIDLLDFDGNGVIESPPMTDENGVFVLDADGERFSLVPAAGGAANALLYYKWGASRSFQIEVDRATGQANVTVNGGVFAGFYAVQLQTKRFGLGVSGFNVSTFINNPSWVAAGGGVVNPTGVAELGVVRIALAADRPGASGARTGMGHEETVQTTMLRPRN